tara:strand:- start:1007 stop:1828 length:822 start_codon:yes stop_codon:yes gene_type:complete
MDRVTTVEPTEDQQAEENPVEPAGEQEPTPEETPDEKIVRLEGENKKLEIERNRAASSARREEKRKREAVEAELAAFKSKEEAGPRPMPPDRDTFQDALGVIDKEAYQTSLTKYEDNLHSWRESQNTPAAPTPAAEDGVNVGAPQNFWDRAETMKATNPDFDESLAAGTFNQPLVNAFADSEVGPEIAYHLSKNPEEARRIGDLPEAELNREIGKLEGRFSVTPEPRAISNAPEPLNPLRGNAPVAKDPEKMNTEEWMAHEKERQIKKMGLSP